MKKYILVHVLLVVCFAGLVAAVTYWGRPPAHACSCKPGATCQRKCAEPCACRVAVPVAPAGLVAGECCNVLQSDARMGAQPVPDAKPVLLAFHQRINPACIKMKRELERRPDVKAAVSKVYDLRLYDWVKDKDLCDRYAVRDVPTCIVLGPEGKELKRFTGYKTPNEILRWLDLPCPQ